MTEPPRGHHEASRGSNRLGNPQPFLPEGSALSKRAQLSMAYGEAGMRDHCGQENTTKAPAAPRPLEGRHRLLEEVDRPPIVALLLVRLADVAIRQRLQDGIPAGHSECEGALSGGDGLVICAAMA